jgi:hypothetical protein
VSRMFLFESLVVHGDGFRADAGPALSGQHEPSQSL